MRRQIYKRLSIFVLCALSFLTGILLSGKADPDAITAAVVAQASSLWGQKFTPAEADSMLGNLNDYRSAYTELHKLRLSNSVSPSLYFNPLPVGYTFPDKANGFKLKSAGTISLPVNRDDLAFYSVRDLGLLLRMKKITSVELTRFFLNRLRRYDPKLLFAVTITEDLALRQAAKADAEIKAGKYRGPLHGIPFGAKDLLAVKEYKTTWGSVAYKDQVLNEDATIIQRLEDAGAVLIAKTTLGELAQAMSGSVVKPRTPGTLPADQADRLLAPRLRFPPGACHSA